ncbi:MAG: hypothetical protein A2Y87_04565 [Bacteroidetes bacterium RBG_13_46_8]|nr:MAG: hypothetical protein A2Y87_04565 [Bacteroidetes bacterium RBG_13_46_8]
MKRLLTLIIIVSVISLSGFSQVNNAKAMFLYNFSRLIKWPDSNSQNEFVFGPAVRNIHPPVWLLAMFFGRADFFCFEEIQ